ncbi:MAG: tRNA preQ1(34) S-adenosylmethionine ribosyltransferase-isomerase QueA [Candidatus Eisenbacteria bacterium]|uniref:S-adenosylmethionine:tRNA ribosyltransferase-isomerase n=1 Tax=Eiseniibacteriota bacterium TaxID=2212470 RepID=A0A956RMG5_UNCEI|nr:tRNA preQ1(34) S-adenosylmethionine ribosyltransferase-isomerase QueA [Candidatus Eisenbacteria bacterium]
MTRTEGRRTPADEPDWLAEYDYSLPDEAIARVPVEPRDASRLLLLPRSAGEVGHHRFAELPDLLEPGDCLVVNETRVLPARMFSRLARTGRRVEILLSHPDPDPATPGAWVAILGGSHGLTGGDVLALPGDAGTFRIVERVERERWRILPEGDPLAMMEAVGHLPIPPYLHREDRTEDRTWYQTVFAREAGAIAAPTAGLHFTESVLDRLRARDVAFARIVLHVGPGTFLPVRATSVEDHRVLPERYSVSDEAALLIERTRARGGRVLAVGTTVARTLETVAAQGAVRAGSGWTDLTILPGHRFRSFDGLITNFHLPRSSLLLLVAAFGGRERVLAAYREAVSRGYRFYSYGDAMLIV